MGQHRPLAVLCLLLALVACGGERPAADASRRPAVAAGCPSGTDPLADFVPFVQHGGVHYVRSWPVASVSEHQLGPVVGTVTCMRSASSLGGGQPVRDGDAAYLAVGTQLRALSGVDPRLRLAVPVADGWEVYDAHDVPGARTGAGQLDLRQVVRVSLVESQDGVRVVRSVDAGPDVARLVAAVRSAPVVAEDEVQRAVRGPMWFVRFELADGPPVQRAWYPEGSLLFPRIAAPPLLRELLRV